MGVLTLNKKYLDRSSGVALKMRTRITITGLLLLAVAAASLNIQQQSSLAFAAREDYMFARTIQQQTYLNL
jgi:hypothetical protein